MRRPREPFRTRGLHAGGHVAQRNRDPRARYRIRRLVRNRVRTHEQGHDDGRSRARAQRRFQCDRRAVASDQDLAQRLCARTGSGDVRADRHGLHQQDAIAFCRRAHQSRPAHQFEDAARNDDRRGLSRCGQGGCERRDAAQRVMRGEQRRGRHRGRADSRRKTGHRARVLQPDARSLFRDRGRERSEGASAQPVLARAPNQPDVPGLGVDGICNRRERRVSILRVGRSGPQRTLPDGECDRSTRLAARRAGHAFDVEALELRRDGVRDQDAAERRVSVRCASEDPACV